MIDDFDGSRPLKVSFNLIKQEELNTKAGKDVAYVDFSTRKLIENTWNCRSWPIVAALSDSFDPVVAQKTRGNTFVVIEAESGSDCDSRSNKDTVELAISWNTSRLLSLQADRNYFLYPVDSLIPLDELLIGTDLPLKEASDIFCDLLETKVPLLIRQGHHTLDHDHLLSLSCNPACQGAFLQGTTKTSFVSISPHHLTRVLSEGRRRDVQKITLSSLQIELSPCELRIQLLSKQVGNKAGASDDDCIFLCKSTCFRLRIKANEWYNVKISSSNSTSHWRPVQVHLCPFNQADDSVTVSPILFHNLLDLQATSLARCELKKCVLTIDPAALPIELSKLTDSQFLRSIHIALIPSPGYPGSIQVDNLLKNYFSIPRLVMKHDVLAIHSLVWPCVNNEISTLNFPIIYFKVTKLEGTGFFVMKDQTTLYHTGNMHSLVPALDESYFACNTSGTFSCIPSRINCLDSFLSLLEPYWSGQLSSPVVISLAGTGALAVIDEAAKLTHRQMYSIDFNGLLMDTPSATETRLKSVLSKIPIYAPCITVFHNFDLLCMEDKGNDERYVELIQETLQLASSQSAPFPVICIAHLPSDEILANNASYGMLFSHKISLPSLSFEERRRFLETITSDVDVHLSVDFNEIAKSTNGFTVDHLTDLVDKALSNRASRLAQYNSLCHSLAGLLLLPEDITCALQEMNSKFKKFIGAPEIPQVKWSDIGGLDHVRDEIMDMIQLPLQCPELFVKSGLRRGGILLHGPPGTGKTLIAKAVATECCINFLSVKGPELINMYVGQSEANVRSIFATARSSAPCVVFFDELDSLAPNRGQSGDSGGVMDRVVSQLLSEMDGVGTTNNVFLIGATNRVDLIDPAMLRPGRFDKVVYIGVPESAQARIQVLRALTRKFSSAHELDYESIESLCPANYSGAEFYALCSCAMKIALRRCVEDIDSGLIPESSALVHVTMEHFLAALNAQPANQSTDVKNQ